MPHVIFTQYHTANTVYKNQNPEFKPELTRRVILKEYQSSETLWEIIIC